MKPITATAEQIVDAITPVINSCLLHSNRSIPRELLIEAIEGMSEPPTVCLSLQREFEATGYASWINSDLYPDGKIYTKEYTEWLERKIVEATNTNPSPPPPHVPQ